MHRTRHLLDRALQIVVQMTKHPLATLIASQLGQTLKQLPDSAVASLAEQLLDWSEELKEALDADRAAASGDR